MFRGLFGVERRATDARSDELKNWLKVAPETSTKGDPLGLDAVVAAVGIRAGMFAQLPWAAFRKDTASGRSISIPDPTLLTAPSRQPLSVWQAQMSISRDLWGTAFGRVTARDSAGVPVWVEWLPPQNVTVTRPNVGFGPHQIQLNGVDLDPAELVIVPSRFVLPGEITGRPPLDRTGLVELGRLAQDYARDWFRDGSVPSIVVKSDQRLTQEEAVSLASSIRGAWRSRRPAVIGSGLTVEQIDQKVGDATASPVPDRVAVAVARCFNIDPADIAAAQSGTTVTYASRVDAKQATIDRFAADLQIVQDVFSGLLPRGQFVKFNTGAYLMSDIRTRFEVYKMGLDMGLYDVAWVRDKEDLPQ